MDIWSVDTSVMESDRRPLVDEHGYRLPNDECQPEGGSEARPVSSVAAVVTQPVSPPTPPTTLYAQRWYILVLFAMLCFLQGGIWNTWGPLSDSTKLVFGWTQGDIALLSNWGPITYLISTPFFAWLMDVKGLRAAALVTGFLVAGGTGLRCITSTNPAATWLIHIGQVLNGFGGPVAMGAAPLVSALWFPAYQRTTATAFVTIMNGIGVAVSFIIGPLLVPDRNSTHSGNTSEIFLGNTSQHGLEEIKSDIMKLMYIEFGVSAAVFLLIIIYFPNKPPKAPSITATIERVDFKDGVKQLFSHRRFWILAAPYAISGGVYNCWASVLDTNLQPLGVSEIKAGWLGFYSTVAGNVAGLVIAGFADIFKKRMKLYMLVLFTGAVAAFGMLAVAGQGILPASDDLLYPSLILGAICLSGCTPMFFELCCEATYPIAEGVTNSLLTWLNNVAGFIFLLLMMIPNIGTIWMNWCMVGSIVLCIPILCVVKERYTRLDIDIETPGVSTSSHIQVRT